MSEFPAGTVTFLFTDIEGSTGLLKQLGDEYAKLLTEQRTLLREIFNRWKGQEVDTQGDSFFYSFTRASDAINAVIEAQRVVVAHDWPKGVELPIRMGLHTGEPLNYDEGYVGMDVHRAARIASAGHGGQILLSETTAPLVLDSLPEAVSMIDLGRHRLKDMKRPERIMQLVLDGAKQDFPPLKSLEVLPTLDALSMQVSLPAFLAESDKEPPPPVFVARENELSRLEQELDQAVRGNGRVIFVSGGPGRGKTALMEAFGRRATDSHSDLLMAKGSCSAYRGVGDPYQPFRQALSMLCGDVEPAWASGEVSHIAASRLWEAMPKTVRSIVEIAPDLLDTFVAAQDLAVRMSAALESRPSWLERLTHIAERRSQSTVEREKEALFEQYERVLKGLCSEHTLLMLLDDLQWVDSASLDLLFHLGRCVEDHPILILGAFRPEEVALGRDGGPHPLAKVLAEFKRRFGQNVLDLGESTESEERQFVDDLLDTEPNRLGSNFRSALHAHTSGHPLFTVESLRNMQERGDLVRDHEGAWMDTKALDWSSFPARVEGVIEERVGRLGEDLKRILEIASVEGVVFTSGVVAEVEGTQERSLLRQLSLELGQQHRLIQEHGILQIDGQRHFQYRFRHELFQQHLYTHLPAFERSALHKEVGDRLEGIYRDQSQEIAPQLAVHFDKAGDPDRALEYLVLAGDQARMIYANTEAIGHYRRALELLQPSIGIDEKARLYMKLGLVYTASFQNDEASLAYEHAFKLWEDFRNSEQPSDWKSSPNVLRMAIKEPALFDPGSFTDDPSMFVLNQLYEGLTRVDDESNVLPAAASRWEVLDGGLRYIFHIREDGYWSDGTRLRASDFQNAWVRNIGLWRSKETSSYFFPIKNARAYANQELSDPSEIGVRAIDDTTLEVCLESPTAFLPYLFSLPDFFPLHPFFLQNEMYLEAGTPPPISNGPFYLADYTPGEKLILRRTPFYRGSFPGNLTEIECPFITDYEDILDRYSSDQLDAVDLIVSDLGTMARIRRRFGDDISFIPHLSTFYLTFRVDQPPFDDVRVRRAFACALDKISFAKNAAKGDYEAAEGGFIPPNMPGHSNGIGISYDEEMARNYLKEAGFPDGHGFPSVKLMHAEGPSDNHVVPFLLESWKIILNVEVSTNPMEWSEFLVKRYSDPSELAVCGWFADYPDPDNFLRHLFHSEEGSKPGRWHNEVFDAFLDKAIAAMDQSERLELYRRADEILVAEEVAVVPIYYAQGRMLAKPWVSMPRIPPAMLQLKEVVIDRNQAPSG